MPDKYEQAFEKFMDERHGAVTLMEVFLAGWKHGLEEAKLEVGSELQPIDAPQKEDLP